MSIFRFDRLGKTRQTAFYLENPVATMLDILRKAAMILGQSSSDAWVRLRQSPAFWDVDVRTLDPNRHAAWIIDRILQFGQWDEWMALFHLYDSRTIRDAVNHRRVLHHVRQFWQSYARNLASDHCRVMAPPRIRLVSSGISLVPGYSSRLVSRASSIRGSRLYDGNP